jgi:hypothetical protein
MSKRNQAKRGKKNDGVDAKVGGRKGRGLLQVSPVCLPPCIGIKLPHFLLNSAKSKVQKLVGQNLERSEDKSQV